MSHLKIRNAVLHKQRFNELFLIAPNSQVLLPVCFLGWISLHCTAKLLPEM